MNIMYSLAESSISGANKSMCILAEYMMKQGNNVFVILPEKGNIEKELVKRNIKYSIIKSYQWIRTLNDKSIKTTLKLIIKKIINYFSIINIRKVIKEKKIDIVHNNSSSSYVAIVAAQKEKIKSVWHFREFMEEDHGICISKVFNYKKIISKCDKKIAISKSVLNKYKKIYKNENIELIYNGIKIEDFEMKERENKDTFINISIIGRVSEGKGQEEFIRAIELVNNPNIRARIIGDNKTEFAKKLKDYVAENKIENIEFIDVVDDIQNFYKSSDIIVVASRCEAFGRVTIESMLSYNLVIGANTGATVELIKNKETGLIYIAGDYKDLSNKINYAIQNKIEINNIKRKAQIYAKEKFNSIKNAESIENLYKAIK